jgi:hypothetical protein
MGVLRETLRNVAQGFVWSFIVEPHRKPKKCCALASRSFLPQTLPTALNQPRVFLCCPYEILEQGVRVKRF